MISTNYSSVIVARPAGLTEADWSAIAARIVGAAVAQLDGVEDPIADAVRSSPLGGCSERTWCVLGPADDHLEHHAGPIVDLANYDEEASTGWYAYAYEKRGHRPRVVIEGRHDDTTGQHRVEVDRADALMVLASTVTEPALDAMFGLLELLEEGLQ